MRPILVAVLAAAIGGLLSPQNAQQQKRRPPDVEVVESKARRVEPHITLDGRVRIAAERPIRGLVLVFDFRAPGGAVITSQKTQVESENLDPGHESSFHAVLVDPVRAVDYMIRAFDSHEKDLRVANAGPFSIE